MKIGLLYLLFGWSWILASEYLLHATGLFGTEALLYSLAKGLLFVLASALLLGWLVYRAGRHAGYGIGWHSLTRHYYESLFARHPEPVYLLDRHGRVIEANPAAARMAGLETGELLGRHYESFLTPEMRTHTRAQFEGAWRARRGISSRNCSSPTRHPCACR